METLLSLRRTFLFRGLFPHLVKKPTCSFILFNVWNSAG